jgi:hypothetical protein
MPVETRAQEFRVSNSKIYQPAEEVRENIQGMARMGGSMGVWECKSVKVWECGKMGQEGTGRDGAR